MFRTADPSGSVGERNGDTPDRHVPPSPLGKDILAMPPSFTDATREHSSLLGGQGNPQFVVNICNRYHTMILDSERETYDTFYEHESLPLSGICDNAITIGAYSRKARKRLNQTMAEIFELFPPLAARRKQLGVSLSGGEQQMLAIGRGLMSMPSLLMLDEPSLGLAPIMVKLVFEIIEKINAEGVTILLVEQNVRQTLQHAETAYVLETGRIKLKGRGSELLENPHIKKAYLGL